MLFHGLAFSQNMPTLAACKGLPAQYQHWVPELQDGSKESEKSGNEEVDK